MMVGIDGCKYGWVDVSLTGVSANLFKNIKDVIDFFPENSLFLIDMPIGLASIEHVERGCEQAARKFLTPKRKSSLFSVPCREAVYAESYEEANTINKRIINKGISKQSWNIVSKIREVDQLLQHNRSLVSNLRESHPEVAFYFLNDQQSMEHNKKRDPGHQERLQVLNRYTDRAELIFKNSMNDFKRKDVSADDILDSVCLAVTLEQMVKNRTPFESCNLDSKGIPMKIHHAEPD